ncbi:MAG TPA: redoxin domain-containing protein [Noviherbaspirillum sp.]|uniref:TlpA family protein disulfide reductase n=1 Tax=Noviherbaspirillum sp. TaxID=1926288 RepID=UPI002B46B5F6|nr:redoxin domain-containing protein [Noviherbaspirillum sp.]HJV84188.1 redoxin domain-containing protein [Noviherbaspirillum sp.]
MPARAIRIRRVVFALTFVTAAISWQPSWGKEPALQRWPNGTPTPSLALRDPDGREWKLQDLRGKVIVLNFWASWCAPCVDEIPLLNELAGDSSLAGKVAVLGVNFKESASTIQRFSHEHQFGYPILLDKSGDAFKKWTSGVLPTTVLIDRNGRARWRTVGELERTDSSLKGAIEKLLNEQGQRRPK